MKIRFAALAATTLAALASAPAFANDQLIANAGLTPAEAAGLTLTEIAAAKFSRNADNDDRQWIVSRDGPTDPALLAAAVARFNRNADHDERQVIVTDRGTGGDWSQLAASAGIDAEGRSLNEVAVAKFNRNADHDKRQVLVARSGAIVASR